MPSPTPLCLSMVICDAVWRDPVSDKRFLLGLFEDFRASEFPALHPGITVFSELTDSLGVVEFEVRLLHVSAAGAYRIHAERRKVNFPDRHSAVRVIFSLVDVTLPEAGDYRLELDSDGVYLSGRRFTAWRIPTTP